MSEVRKKSPRAPTLALPDALDRVEKIYAQEGRHATPAEIVAQALGYKSATNGSAAQAIASLRYYGLLERPKDGVLAVSKDYENYKYGPDESQKQAYLIGWLRTPLVFSTLLDKYDSRLPSDANIRFDLISMGFIPGGADAYVSAFRRSVEFSRLYDKPPAQWDGGSPPEISGFTEPPLEQSEPLPPPAQQASQPQTTWGQMLSGNAAQAVTNFSNTATTNTPDVIRVPVRLPKGRCAWLELPIPFYEADKERLKAYIDMQLADDTDAE
ncbi:hypothetical protein [Burkholderia aenigmatica]|uniref:Uncharacterized protein n=1 Tax=Burkholderia aenigmatica TaxID=2015348 RepID=A0A228J3P9_9BURK|nr:hypothetical protein [Burkholderia aenigmatica]OXI49178.1 hypothetical protein CFB84_09965 [Burkholderia aenigmatica]